LVQRYTNIPNSVIYFNFLPLIEINKGLPLDKIIHKYRDQLPFDVGYLADQVMLYPKAQIKLPSFSTAGCFYSPQSFEQASSEALALYKASLVRGEQIIDLSAGLGVDDWAFCKTFSKVTGIDVDYDLNMIAEANFKRLGIENYRRITATAESFLEHFSEKVDVMYLDADRRAQNKRSYALADSSPNILELKETIFQFCNSLLVKVSPMLDLSELARQLTGIQHIHVVSFKNEVKEILLEISEGQHNQIQVTAAELNDVGIQYQYSGIFEKQNPNNSFAFEGEYFYEPGLSIIKAGLTQNLYATKGIKPIASNSVYGVSDHLVPHFEGRTFEICSNIPFSKKNVQAYLKSVQIRSANIAKRHFPIDVLAIKTLFRLQDGGRDFLFFTTDALGQKRMYHCRKLVVAQD
jgi:hypothetical protein